MNNSLFSVQHLTKRYGDATVVNDVSFEIAAGRVPGRDWPQWCRQDHHHPHVPGPGDA
jgi:hypothetical protein